MTLCYCHSTPCFKVFQSNLYSVLEFYHLLYFKIQKLVEKYMYYCICYYLAELLAIHLAIYVYRRTYKNYLQVFTRIFYQIKKNYLWPRGAPCSAGALGPGLADLCLKTALGLVVMYTSHVLI